MNAIFTRDFDDEREAELRAARHRALARHTPEELAEACALARSEAQGEGFLAGHSAGVTDATQKFEGRRAVMLEQIAPRIEGLFSQAESHRKLLEEQVLEFILSLCEQLFPQVLKLHALDRLREEIRTTIEISLGSPELRLVLSRDAMHHLRPDIEAMASAAGRRDAVRFETDLSLEDGDMRADWHNGFSEYSYALICERILDALRAQQPAHPHSAFPPASKASD